jgi:hypothetical protein
VDFGEATLTRVTFPGSRWQEVHLNKATLTEVDLRGATELDLATGFDALRGATISESQLIALAPAIASALGITVKERQGTGVDHERAPRSYFPGDRGPSRGSPVPGGAQLRLRGLDRGRSVR